MNHLLHNPYHFAGALVARIATCSATIIWSLIVLSRENALNSPNYQRLNSTGVPEDLWAVGVALIALAMLMRIVRQSRPSWIGVIGHGLLCFFWAYLLFNHLLEPARAYPAVTALEFTIVGLSIYGFVSNAKDDHGIGA